jgi:hypothetical protein
VHQLSRRSGEEAAELRRLCASQGVGKVQLAVRLQRTQKGICKLSCWNVVVRANWKDTVASILAMA